MTKYKCTVGVPCLDSYEGLVTWREVINDLPFVQFLFVDGGSVDGSGERLMQWSTECSNVSVIFNYDGLYSAMNCMIDDAEADWLYICGVTDRFDGRLLNTTFSNDFGAVVYSLALSDESGSIKKRISSKIFKRNLPHHQSIVMNRHHLNKNSIRFDETMKYFADAKVIAYLKYETKVDYRDESLGVFMLGGKSTNGRDNYTKIIELISVYRPYKKYFLLLKSVLRLFKYV